jgi:hypothetical protein
MKVYLAGFKTIEKHWGEPTEDIYLLSSFYEHKNGAYGAYVRQSRHMLDSGAFTFIQNKKKTTGWDEYIERYAQFINENNIDLFFELDIDSVVGLKEVERLRDKLETLTNKKSIPVWHKSRGQAYWLAMCEEYDYVAIGGIASGEIKKDEYRFFPTLINLAKERGAKVHGLGFTSVPLLFKYRFYSVDSTTWNVGGKYGNVCVIDLCRASERPTKETERDESGRCYASA